MKFYLYIIDTSKLIKNMQLFGIYEKISDVPNIKNTILTIF